MFVMESDQLEFGCGLGDVICVAFEAQARGLGAFVGWLAEILLGSQDMAPGSSMWQTATDEASNWFAIAIIVMLASGIIGLSTGMLSMKPRNLWVTIGGLAAAIPSTYLALGVGGELLKISDDMSDLILKRLGGAEGFATVFRMIAQGGTGSDWGGTVLNLASGGTASAMPVILMLVIVIIGLILMSFAIAFRNLGLMVLIAFSPLAFMAVPMKGGWGIAKKWATAGIALLLAKPLMFGILAMILKQADGIALFSPETLTVATGLFVVSFMPMMAYSFFSFLGAGNENNAGQNMAGQAAQQAKSSVSKVTNLASKGGGGFKSGGGSKSGGSPKGGGGQKSGGMPSGSSPSGKGGNQSGGSSQPGGQGGQSGQGTSKSGGSGSGSGGGAKSGSPSGGPSSGAKSGPKVPSPPSSTSSGPSAGGTSGKGGSAPKVKPPVSGPKW